MVDVPAQDPDKRRELPFGLSLAIMSTAMALFVGTMLFLMNMWTDSQMDRVTGSVERYPEEFRSSPLSVEDLKTVSPDANGGFLIGFDPDLELDFGHRAFLRPHLPVLCVENQDGSLDAFLVYTDSGYLGLQVRKDFRSSRAEKRLTESGFCQKSLAVPDL